MAEVIKRNPGTVRNQMQALKAIGLVDGIPGPKGGYNPTTRAYWELNLGISEGEYEVLISRDGEEVRGVKGTGMGRPFHSKAQAVRPVRSGEIAHELIIKTGRKACVRFVMA